MKGEAIFVSGGKAVTTAAAFHFRSVLLLYSSQWRFSMNTSLTLGDKSSSRNSWYPSLR